MASVLRTFDDWPHGELRDSCSPRAVEQDPAAAAIELQRRQQQRRWEEGEGEDGEDNFPECDR